MKNKIFLISFIIAVVLHLLFFHVLRIESPGVIAITESEVYLIDDFSAAEDTPVLKVTEKSSKVAPFFSLPGVYQKIYSSDMKHSISTLREETDISGYDPFKQDKKIISHSMDFSPVINRVSSKVHTIITSGEKELLESLTNKGGGSISIRLSKSLLKFFNEDIINNELKDNYLEPGSKMNIQVIFFNKNSFSVMLDKEKGIPSKELFIVFNKALLRKRFIPKKVTGNIYVWRER